MMMNREQVSVINAAAQQNFETAKAMLEAINMVLGTKYGWLNKRVVEFENPDASTCEKYAHCHDAWARAEE